MRQRFRHRRGQQSEELNITAFMNLMVVLVPFLLISAVFSRITVLELNLPVDAEEDTTAPQERPLQLEVTVREASIEVAYHGGARVARVERGVDGYDLDRLSDLLREVKGAFPDAESATILLEPEVPYDALVQVMDVVRLYAVEEEGGVRRADLFPQIAIGDAPAPRTEP